MSSWKKIAFSTLAAIRFQSWRERCESRQSCSRDLCCVRRRFYARKNGSMVVFTLQKQKFKLKDAARSGRPVGFDEDRLNHLLRENPCQSTRELAEQLTCDQKTVVKHLHSMGKVQKLCAWVPHALSQNNKLQRSMIAAGLLARHKATHGHKQRFLYRSEKNGSVPKNKQHCEQDKDFILGRQVCCFGSKRVEPMRQVFGLSPSNEGGSLQSSDHTSIVQPILWSIDADFHGEYCSTDLHQTQWGDRNVPRP